MQCLRLFYVKHAEEREATISKINIKIPEPAKNPWYDGGKFRYAERSRVNENDFAGINSMVLLRN